MASSFLPLPDLPGLHFLPRCRQVFVSPLFHRLEVGGASCSSGFPDRWSRSPNEKAAQAAAANGAQTAGLKATGLSSVSDSAPMLHRSDSLSERKFQALGGGWRPIAFTFTSVAGCLHASGSSRRCSQCRFRLFRPAC